MGKGGDVRGFIRKTTEGVSEGALKGRERVC